ncbi:uncharacterized protein LOC108674616 [Hyalella azteca]|uniref:Uncharacterized protein LOC108674616 n=1 Tax=Hyalella azteca TaxID=294128 RepID=A0A8B7NWC9_HYAAZ|nr:uncharacterized protein LOC108674616 [Hyalella azteca]XP_047737356.1 uncharacterized protein LOC108674616 [Hyalella azteca]
MKLMYVILLVAFVALAYAGKPAKQRRSPDGWQKSSEKLGGSRHEYRATQSSESSESSEASSSEEVTTESSDQTTSQKSPYHYQRSSSYKSSFASKPRDARLGRDSRKEHQKYFIGNPHKETVPKSKEAKVESHLNKQIEQSLERRRRETVVDAPSDIKYEKKSAYKSPKHRQDLPQEVKSKPVLSRTVVTPSVDQAIEESQPDAVELKLMETLELLRASRQKKEPESSYDQFLYEEDGTEPEYEGEYDQEILAPQVDQDVVDVRRVSGIVDGKVLFKAAKLDSADDIVRIVELYDLYNKRR